MSKVRDYQKLAVDVIEAVGGQENIANATKIGRASCRERV